MDRAPVVLRCPSPDDETRNEPTSATQRDTTITQIFYHERDKSSPLNAQFPSDEMNGSADRRSPIGQGVESFGRCPDNSSHPCRFGRMTAQRSQASSVTSWRLRSVRSARHDVHAATGFYPPPISDQWRGNLRWRDPRATCSPTRP